MERSSARLDVATLAIAPLGIAAGLAYLPCVLDDAFITFRYAANLAEHGELTFNVGAPAVEGFSSPLWALLLSAVAALFTRALLPVGAAVLGVLMFVLALLLTRRMAVRVAPPEPDPRLGALISVGLLALSPAAALYATTGLEPLLFVVVTLGVAGAALGALPRWVGLACAALASWARPEGPFLAVPLLIVGFRHPSQRRDVLWLAVALVAGSAALLVGRLLLFADWLPNTFYAKRPEAWAGLSYVGALLITPWAAGTILLGTLGALWGRGRFATLAIMGWCWLGAAALEGGDWMPLGRFALPAFACFGVAAAGCAGAMRARRWLLAALLAIVAVSSAAATNNGITSQHRQRRTIYQEGRVLAGWLKRAQVKSLALVDIGEIGFSLDAEIIDLVGLTDRKIARAQGAHLMKRLDTKYVLGEHKPDAVVIRTERPPFTAQQGIDPAAAATQPEFDLLVDPVLRSDYQLLFALAPDVPRASFYGALVFTRKELILPESARLPGLVVSVSPLAD